ncbi:MAG: hypothetical protein HYV97_19600 [Bdellovibrio sp.]|nr:hypothetical protein [Bdellovibrio sp.]
MKRLLTPKKSLALCAAIFLLCVSVAALADIEGSKHDFTFAANECEVCHTPHRAYTAAAPLWRHHDPALDVTVYEQYQSVDVRGTLEGTVGQPNGISKLCLNCHNGITGPAGMTQILGTDLKNDHPISFTFDSTLATADGYLYDPATHPSGVTPDGTLATDLLRGPLNDQLECVSCHEVHNRYNNFKMLVLPGKANAGDGQPYDAAPQTLCKACHMLGTGVSTH